MSESERLPNRRGSLSFNFVHDGRAYHATATHYTDGRLAEIFLDTDKVGSDVDNLSLSDRRAESAATLLTQQFNVPAENLTSQGYGEQYPKEQTDGPSAINRRVTIRNITPLLNGGQASLPPPPPGTAPPR